MRNVTLPRMTPGLAHTTQEACQQLLLTVLGRALMEDDHEFFLGPIAYVYMRLLGWDDATILAARIAYCRNEFGPRRVWMSSMDAPRRDRDGAEETTWDAWPALAR
jgi:hypothetical protein